MAQTYQMTRGKRLANRLMSAALRAGFKPNTTYLLTVPGRRTGKPHSTPITLMEEDGRRWLVAPYGEVNWVRNARAAGQAVLTRGRRTETVPIEEVDARTTAPVLKMYANRVPITRPYFDANPEDPVERFELEAKRHPVFRIGEAAPSSS